MLIAALGLAGCTKPASDDSAAASRAPASPAAASPAAASPTPPRLATLDVTIHCTNGLYCTNMGGSSCTFSDSFKPFPNQSVTVSDVGGTVLAAESLPLDGEVTGSADIGNYRCTAQLTFRVPDDELYKVDAFGFTTRTDNGPFTLSIP
ncbi:hypothetical protein ACVCAH_34210 [Micromonospora sp. LZ34]